MEEVWKDISLSSLQNHISTRDDHRATTSHGMSFQDILGLPFSTNPPISSTYCSPATMSTFKSAQKPHFLGNSHYLKHNPFPQNQTTPPVDPFASASGLVPNGKKKFFESDQNDSGDTRHKKMIKNRESSARSRARKQAYTDELELELARLLKENAKLKKQQQQLCLAVEVEEHKKHKLSRARSAPF